MSARILPALVVGTVLATAAGAAAGTDSRGAFPGTGDYIAYTVQATGPGANPAKFVTPAGTLRQGPTWMSGVPSFSRDGTKVAWNSTLFSEGVRFANGDGSGLVEVVASSVDIEFASISPDGTKIAVARRVNPGSVTLHVVNAAAGQTVGVSNEVTSGELAAPQWGPTGKIAFTMRASVSGTFQDCVYIVDPTPAATPQLLANTCIADNIADNGLSWSPDGARIAYFKAATSGSNPNYDLTFVDPASGAVTTPGIQARTGAGTPAFSPDGTKLAYSDSCQSGCNPTTIDLKVIGWTGTAVQGSPTTVPVTMSAGLTAITWGPYPGEASSGGDTPAPAPGPTTPGAATLLRAATVSSTRQAERIGCSQVSVPVQLNPIGRYTFIFEGPGGQVSTSVELQNGARVVQQRGSRLGTRVLGRNATAPVLTTTEANKRLVVSALIKKAKAKNLRLRVIHTAANGTLTQDVFTT